MDEIVENAVEVMTRTTWFSRLPKWLRVVLMVISIITLVYWVGFALYKILEAIRIIMAYIFEKRNYWTFLICILLIAIGGLLLGEFYFGLEPFNKIAQWFVDLYESVREWLRSLI